MTPAIVFLTGASGSGKTTIVRELSARNPQGIYFHFDTIGVPDDEAMMREFGSGEAWQAEMTRRWVARICTEHGDRQLVVIEGQARPSFIEAALVEHRVSRSAIVLVHCDDDERDARLHSRGQPELANRRMRSWARFLHHEARERGLRIIDTTATSTSEVAAVVRELARQLVEESRRADG